MSVIYRELHRVDFSLFIQDPTYSVWSWLFVLQILFWKYFYIPSLLCYGIFMLCLNDSFFFLKPIVVSQKEKKGGAGAGGGGGGGGVPMLGLWDLRTGFL